MCGYDYYSKRIGDQLSGEEREYLNTYMPLVESIIRRASSYPTEEQKKVDELAIQGDCLNTLEVERNAFRFGEGHGLPKFFKMVDNVKREMIIKIWIGNTLHCSYAYLGQYYHLHSSFEAAVNDYVSKCSYYACEEAYNAVAKQLGLPMPRPVKEWQGIWTYYRNPSLQDTVLRIGADPIRKLSRNERFIGPALMSLENGDVPVFICCISQIEYIVDHFLFVRFDNTIFMADIYDRTKFFFCHSLISSIRIHTKQFHEYT